jgi:hypothetical protein
VQAGQAVGDDLGCGSGGSFGGLLVGELFRCGFGGGGSDCQIVLCLERQRRLGTSDDEDFLELVEVSRGAKFDERVRLVVGVGRNRLDGTYG